MSKNRNAIKVIELCEKHWESNKKNCSGFIKAVAKELTITVHGQANDIVDAIQKPLWKTIESGLQAQLHAANGMFVVAGLKSDPHGHVVVIVDGQLSHGKYPSAYWGSLGGVPKKNTTINWSWNKADRDKVIYSYRPIK